MMMSVKKKNNNNFLEYCCVWKSKFINYVKFELILL